jgi:hypothetical protein
MLLKVKIPQPKPRQASLKLLTALIFVMSVFIFPQTVSAATPTNVNITTNNPTNNSTANTPPNPHIAPPTVFAEINGTLLQIDAVSGFFAVEAVFINDRRFNFRVEPPSLDSFLPPPIQTNPLTPDGQATVVDNVTDMDGVEFFTFFTPSGNVFHLIVDRQRGSENVYFLNAVTEFDLMALAEASGVNMPDYTISGIPATPILPEETPQEPEPEETPDEPRSGMGGGTIFFLLLIFAAVGGAGYYFKIVRPKQQQQMMGDDYNEDDDDEYGDYGENNEHDDVEETLDSDSDSEDGYDSEDSER